MRPTTAAIATCLALTLSAAADNHVIDRGNLLYGSPGDGETPVTWLFDPQSGTVLSGNGLGDIECLRADLTFTEAGRVRFAWPIAEAPVHCPQEGAAIEFEIESDPRSTAVQLDLPLTGDACVIEPAINAGPPEELRLLVTCEGRGFDTIQFRYQRP